MAFVDLDKVISFNVGQSTGVVTDESDSGRFIYFVHGEVLQAETLFFLVKKDLATRTNVFSTLLYRHPAATTIFDYQGKYLETKDFVFVPVFGNLGSNCRVYKVDKKTGEIIGQTTGYPNNATIIDMAINEADGEFYVLVSGTPVEMNIHSINGTGVIDGNSVGLVGQNGAQNMDYCPYVERFIIHRYTAGNSTYSAYTKNRVFVSSVNVAGVSAPGTSFRTFAGSDSFSHFINDGVNNIVTGTVLPLTATKQPISGDPLVISVFPTGEVTGSATLYHANGGLFGVGTAAGVAVAGISTTTSSGSPCQYFGGRVYIETSVGLQSFSANKSAADAKVATYYFKTPSQFLVSSS